MWFGILYIGCFVFSTLSLVFRERLAGRRLLEEASRAASLLVWSKRDDGSSTLISVPFNVDGTRGEAPQDAEEWISEDATLGVGIGIFALYVLGLACYLRGSPPFVGRDRTGGVFIRVPFRPITLSECTNVPHAACGTIVCSEVSGRLSCRL